MRFDRAGEGRPHRLVRQCLPGLPLREMDSQSLVDRFGVGNLSARARVDDPETRVVAEWCVLTCAESDDWIRAAVMNRS